MSYIVLRCPNMIDGKTLKLSDVDLEFVTCKANPPIRNRLNPDRQLIRYQFLEMWVRIAVQKYIKSGLMTNHYEAVYKLMEENVLPYLRKFDATEFRIGKLYKETCDYILRKHLQTLKEIYKRASCVDAVPDEDAVMSMGEFVDLMICSGVVDENFGARDVGTLYNLSIITQVDEVHSDRHLQMHFIEFIEGLCRVADKAITCLSDNDGTLIPRPVLDGFRQPAPA